MTDVAVCIATCGRPDGLRRLLEALAAQTYGRHKPSLRYIIADNDAAATGDAVRRVLDDMAQRLDAPIDYEAEPRRGISYARNNTVERALDADFLAFIDDDEAPDTGWLNALLRSQAVSGADVVGGPVLPRFEEPPPEWAVLGRFFELENHPDGAPLDVVFTCNALARGSIFRDGGFRFDERYGLTGGGDTQLFMRVHRAGYAMVWSAGAVAYEYIPAHRMTPKWVVQRRFSIGWRTSFIERDLNPGLGSIARAIESGTMRLINGTADLIRYSFGAPHQRIEALQTIAEGLGRLSVIFGYRSTYYRR